MLPNFLHLRETGKHDRRGSGHPHLLSKRSPQKHSYSHTDTQTHKVNVKKCVHIKSLRLCLTLWDPMHCSPPGFLCPWDSPGRNTRVSCHTLLQGEWKKEALIYQNSFFLLKMRSYHFPGVLVKFHFPINFSISPSDTQKSPSFLFICYL